MAMSEERQKTVEAIRQMRQRLIEDKQIPSESAVRAAQFDDIFRRYGGRLRLESVEHPDIRIGAEGLLTAFRYWISQPYEYAEQTLPFGNVHFDFIDNGSFNAVATVRGTDEFVGIFIGALPIFTIFINAFMSCPSSFPTIGNPSAESQNDETIEMLKRFGSVDRWDKPQHPQDPFRLQITKHMNFVACSSILYHELGHIASCHLPFLRDQFGMLDLQEFSIAPLSSEEASMRRTFELDADRSAVDCSIDSMLKISRDNLAVAHFGPLKLWAAAITLMFLVMEHVGSSQRTNNLVRTHPSVWARIASALEFARQHRQLDSSKHRVDADLKDGVMEILGWWSNNAISSVINHEAMSSGEAEVDELHENYRSLFDGLRDYQIRRRASLMTT